MRPSRGSAPKRRNPKHNQPDDQRDLKHTLAKRQSYALSHIPARPVEKEPNLRNSGRIRLGYFPLPGPEGPRIRARLSFSQQASVLDPCAGTGAALLAVTKDAAVVRFAIELDTDRAEDCAAAGISTIHGNTIEVGGKVQQVSLLYLNPPYDFEIGASDNKRLEQVFLQHCYRWLVPGGVLIFVIPAKALAYCSRTLAGRFGDIRVYQLTHPDSVQYDQLVLFGVRKDQTDRTAEHSQSYLNGLSWRRLNIDPLPEPNDGVWTYVVPPSGPTTFIHQGIDFDLLEDLLPQSNAWRQSRHALLPEAAISCGQPLTPLHGGHVGLLCTSGLMNGAFGEGEERHIARRRTQKVVTVINEEKSEDGATVTRTIERFSHDLALVYEDGRMLTLGTEAPTEDEQEEPALFDEDEHAEGGLPETDTVSLRKAGGELFPLGRTVITPGIRELALEGFNFGPLLERHANGDWGDLSDNDIAYNDAALDNGDERIFSSYNTDMSPDGKIWIITEADRSATTVLLPSEN